MKRARRRRAVTTRLEGSDLSSERGVRRPCFCCALPRETSADGAVSARVLCGGREWRSKRRVVALWRLRRQNAGDYCPKSAALGPVLILANPGSIDQERSGRSSVSGLASPAILAGAATAQRGDASRRETPAPASLASEARAGNPGTSDADALALRDRMSRPDPRVAPHPRRRAATRGGHEGRRLAPLGGWPDVLFAALAQAATMSGFGAVVAALAIAAERVTGSGALGTFALALEFFARASRRSPRRAAAGAGAERCCFSAQRAASSGPFSSRSICF